MTSLETVNQHMQPCPKCGSTGGPQVTQNQAAPAQTRYEPSCYDCLLYGPGFATMQAAIDWWNDRPIGLTIGAQAIAQSATAQASKPDMTGWIHTADQYPEPGERIQVYIDFIGEREGMYTGAPLCNWVTPGAQFGRDCIVYWRPLDMHDTM